MWRPRRDAVPVKISFDASSVDVAFEVDMLNGLYTSVFGSVKHSPAVSRAPAAGTPLESLLVIRAACSFSSCVTVRARLLGRLRPQPTGAGG
jgi:hypothetical protein